MRAQKGVDLPASLSARMLLLCLEQNADPARNEFWRSISRFLGLEEIADSRDAVNRAGNRAARRDIAARRDVNNARNFVR
jgi:hypothetical protein